MGDTFNFENAMNRLNEISLALESETVSLDDSVRLFEEGLELAKKCESELQKYEEKVKGLVNKYQNNDDK